MAGEAEVAAAAAAAWRATCGALLRPLPTISLPVEVLPIYPPAADEDEAAAGAPVARKKKGK